MIFARICEAFFWNFFFFGSNEGTKISILKRISDILEWILYERRNYENIEIGL